MDFTACEFITYLSVNAARSSTPLVATTTVVAQTTRSTVDEDIRTLQRRKIGDVAEELKDAN